MTGAVPEHVGIIVDGNRRWAGRRGLDLDLAYDHGARKAVDVLRWCEELGVRAVTLWLLPLANLDRAERGQLTPDLIIRTAGEQRLSGFLLWQAVHSELYFCRAPWPRLRRRHLVRAVRAYGRRQRTFGT